MVIKTYILQKLYISRVTCYGIEIKLYIWNFNLGIQKCMLRKLKFEINSYLKIPNDEIHKMKKRESTYNQSQK